MFYFVHVKDIFYDISKTTYSLFDNNYGYFFVFNFSGRTS